MAFRLSRFLLKETTGLAGLAVHPTPRPTLISLYTSTLSLLSSLPESSLYRQSVSSLTQHRLSIVQSTEDLAEIENGIKAGQVEELIIQAKEEMGLVEKMAVWKPWEGIEEPEPEKQWDYNFSENKGAR